MWIQTDDGAYTDETNCMLLAAIPGTVGDGKKVTVNSSLTASGATTAKVDSVIGAALGDAKLRRFLVGPKGCEVTGLVESLDGKTLFVNIQHPGENTPAIGAAAEFTFQSQWPGNQGYGVAGRPPFGHHCHHPQRRRQDRRIKFFSWVSCRSNPQRYKPQGVCCWCVPEKCPDNVCST